MGVGSMEPDRSVNRRAQRDARPRHRRADRNRRSVAAADDPPLSSSSRLIALGTGEGNFFRRSGKSWRGRLRVVQSDDGGRARNRAWARAKVCSVRGCAGVIDASARASLCPAGCYLFPVGSLTDRSAILKSAYRCCVRRCLSFTGGVVPDLSGLGGAGAMQYKCITRRAPACHGDRGRLLHRLFILLGGSS